MDKTDLQALLDDFAKIEEASCHIDTLLRSRKKVLAFPDADSLGAFYQPLFGLPDLVRHLIDQQTRLTTLENRVAAADAERQTLQARLAEAERRAAAAEAQVAAAARRVQALIDERAALAITIQAIITTLRALDRAFNHLETHKFKFSIYDLLEKINAVIRPDDRASFEIEGSGIFESVRHTAARSAEPHLSVKRLLEAAQGRLPPSLAADPQYGPALQQLFQELVDLAEQNLERTRTAQKFGLRLKVVNYDNRAAGGGSAPAPDGGSSGSAEGARGAASAAPAGGSGDRQRVATSAPPPFPPRQKPKDA